MDVFSAIWWGLIVLYLINFIIQIFQKQVIVTWEDGKIKIEELDSRRESHENGDRDQNQLEDRGLGPGTGT